MEGEGPPPRTWSGSAGYTRSPAAVTARHLDVGMKSVLRTSTSACLVAPLAAETNENPNRVHVLPDRLVKFSR